MEVFTEAKKVYFVDLKKCYLFSSVVTSTTTKICESAAVE